MNVLTVQHILFLPSTSMLCYNSLLSWCQTWNLSDLLSDKADRLLCVCHCYKLKIQPCAGILCAFIFSPFNKRRTKGDRKALLWAEGIKYEKEMNKKKNSFFSSRRWCGIVCDNLIRLWQLAERDKRRLRRAEGLMGRWLQSCPKKRQLPWEWWMTRVLSDRTGAQAEWWIVTSVRMRDDEQLEVCALHATHKKTLAASLWCHCSAVLKTSLCGILGVCINTSNLFSSTL